MGDLYTALGFSRGALPDAPVSPYAKLLLMLAGIESPGTIQVSVPVLCLMNTIHGSSPCCWSVSQLLDVLPLSTCDAEVLATS